MTAKKNDYEVMGTGKRTVTRPVTDADRARLDATLHRLLDAKGNAKANKARLKTAVGKANERLTALDEEITQLHEEAKITTHDVLEDVEIRRTSTQLFVVSLVDQKVLQQRPLTKEELEALAPQLPNTGPPPVVKHAEQAPDDAAVKKQSEQAEHEAKLAELLREITPDDILRQVDADADAKGKPGSDDANHALPKEPKAKGGKAKKKAEQLANDALGGAPTGAAK